MRQMVPRVEKRLVPPKPVACGPLAHLEQGRAGQLRLRFSLACLAVERRRSGARGARWCWRRRRRRHPGPGRGAGRGSHVEVRMYGIREPFHHHGVIRKVPSEPWSSTRFEERGRVPKRGSQGGVGGLDIVHATGEGRVRGACNRDGWFQLKCFTIITMV